MSTPRSHNTHRSDNLIFGARLVYDILELGWEVPG